MFAVVTVDEDGAFNCLRCLLQLSGAFCRNSIVTEWEMHIPQSVFACAGEIRLAAIHTDDGFHPKLGECREGDIAFRL